MEPKDLTLPSHTAEETVINDNIRSNSDIRIGSTAAWIQTLNSLHREDAQREAEWECAVYISSIKKRSELMDQIEADYSAMEPKAQVDFLASHEFYMGRAQQDIRKELPDELPPVRIENETPGVYADRVAKYQKAQEVLIEKRKKRQDVVMKKLVSTSESLPPEKRVAKCVQAHMELMFAQRYGRAIVNQILLRAVRTSTDHRQRLFSGVEQIEDLDDDVRDGLYAAYQNLDRIQSEMIPT